MAGWITLGIILLILAGLIFYVIIIYNGFVALKNNINQDWSNIDVLLKQRQCYSNPDLYYSPVRQNRCR